MDRQQTAAAQRSWAWLPQHMPGVAKLMREKRATLGNEHVNLCWQRGVVECQPGWLFAIEGPLAVGTPWDKDVVELYLAVPSPTKCMVFIATPGKADGT
jgi:hypothetical protein